MAALLQTVFLTPCHLLSGSHFNKCGDKTPSGKQHERWGGAGACRKCAVGSLGGSLVCEAAYYGRSEGPGSPCGGRGGVEGRARLLGLAPPSCGGAWLLALGKVLEGRPWVPCFQVCPRQLTGAGIGSVLTPRDADVDPAVGRPGPGRPTRCLPRPILAAGLLGKDGRRHPQGQPGPLPAGPGGGGGSQASFLPRQPWGTGLRKGTAVPSWSSGPSWGDGHERAHLPLTGPCHRKQGQNFSI